MPKYALCGKMMTDPHNRQTLIEILSAAADLMQNAEGCQMYIVYRDANDAGAVWITELWDSEEAHDNSLSIEGVKALISRARPILKGSPEQIVMIPVSGKGL